jgi:hypothetical protein
LTYTTLYLLTLILLAITPVTLIYSSIDQSAYQYTFIIGSTYLLTAILAIFIYSSRLYTNRSVLSAVGKAYVPIEDGEVTKMVRRMIVKQLQRSAIIAWEGRPRDLHGEILLARQTGTLPDDTDSVDINEYTVGSVIPLDPSNPPWGDVQHPGWSSPSHREDNKNPHVQYADVVVELPHLIEARAVSLAPPDPTATPIQGQPRAADPPVVALLRRPANMPLRDYLTQLGYLGLIQPLEIGKSFILQYERARFGGKPTSTSDFNQLMATFAELLGGMKRLDQAIVDEIRTQTMEKFSMLDMSASDGLAPDERPPFRSRSTAFQSSRSSVGSPVTAREDPASRGATPYRDPNNISQETLSSVVRHTPEHGNGTPRFLESLYNMHASSSSTLPSDAGSVLIHGRDAGG